jgi:hypothetical protein
MTDKLRSEISIVAGVVLATINAVQAAAINLPAWAHAVIAVVSILAGSLVVRQNVTPTVRAPARPPAPLATPPMPPPATPPPAPPSKPPGAAPPP